MKNFYFILLQIALIDGISLDYFHCKTATCQEFYYGLKNLPRQKDYVNVCYDTVRSLQNISHQYGKCFDDATKKINLSCIHALAKTIKNCIDGLKDIPERNARHYCGYKLMQNCAKYLGLERFPYYSEYQRTPDDNVN